MKTIYQADDGKMFSLLDECLEYETRVNIVPGSMWNNSNNIPVTLLKNSSGQWLFMDNFKVTSGRPMSDEALLEFLVRWNYKLIGQLKVVKAE